MPPVCAQRFAATTPTQGGLRRGWLAALGRRESGYTAPTKAKEPSVRGRSGHSCCAVNSRNAVHSNSEAGQMGFYSQRSYFFLQEKPFWSTGSKGMLCCDLWSSVTYNVIWD